MFSKEAVVLYLEICFKKYMRTLEASSRLGFTEEAKANLVEQWKPMYVEKKHQRNWSEYSKLLTVAFIGICSNPKKPSLNGMVATQTVF